MTSLIAISGMHCQGCAGSVRAALASVPGVMKAEVDVAAGTARIEHSDSTPVESLVRAVSEYGFTCEFREPPR